MPNTPVRTVGEPLDQRDVLEALGIMTRGRLPNPTPPAAEEEIDALLQTDYAVSGHGDDLYLYEEDDLEYFDQTGVPVVLPRRENPDSAHGHSGQPPRATWRIKDTPLRDLFIEVTRRGGEIFTARWKGAALLSAGNSKVGSYTWSIPEGTTCPARSAFCADCYAVSMTKGLKESPMSGSRALRLKAWAEHRVAWRQEMTAECHYYGKLAPIRLHVAGDFFSADYTKDWVQVVAACPEVHFWGYTRSWAVDKKARGAKELLKALEALRHLPNMTLYASFDPTMPTPPKAWLWAGIYGDPRIGISRAGKSRPLLLCPEITGTPQDWAGIREEGAPPLAGDGLPFYATCRNCGWCWNRSDRVPFPSKVDEDINARGSLPMKGGRGDVVFPRHGSVLELVEPGSIPWPGGKERMPTAEEVKTYSVFRNGGGQGNRVVYSTAMAQLSRSAEKFEMARRIVERDMTGHVAQFYEKEFSKLVGISRVAFREMEV